jgi:hypothetical protein
MAEEPAYKRYSRTKKGVTTRIYNTQVRCSKARNHPKPSYSHKELRDWLFGQDLFHILFDIWVASDYNKNLKPSVDRLKDTVHYTMENIQLCTWQENSNRRSQREKLGLEIGDNKKVYQYDKAGIFLNTYHSQIEAERQTGVSNAHISKVCSGTRKTAGGFIWKNQLINQEVTL